MSLIRLSVNDEPTTPSLGKVYLWYDDTDNIFKYKDESGVALPLVGNGILNGTVDPTTEGNDGDFYINTVTDFIFGPKVSGTWPAGVSLVGPTGATGAAGQGVPVGGTTGQLLAKIDGTDYNTQWITASGTGDVVGPSSATDNALARFDTTTGKLIQNSVVTVADSTGNMAGVGTVSSGEITSSSLTASRVLVAGASKEIQSSSVTTTTLGFLDATSSIQTQLNGKQATITGGATTITSSDLTVSRALASDGSGKVAVSTTTATELGYVNGVTSAIQTQLNSKLSQIATSITCVFDGEGAALVANSKAYLEVPYAMTITGWTLLSDVAGSLVIDVWKDTYANYPPVVGDSITGTEKPTLSGTDKNQDLALTTWTTTVSAGDTLVFNVDSATTVTKATLVIRGTRTA